MPLFSLRIGKLVATAFVVLLVVACTHKPPPAEPLRLGLALQPASALAMIALEKGFFSAEGLEVEVESFPSGKRALHEGLLTGRVEVAAVADIPFVIAALDRRAVTAVGTLFAADNVNRVVVRRDLGMAEPGDLRGKRIATQQGSAVHFFLHRFLKHHGLDEQAVESRFMRAEELPLALAGGEIDAFSMREPYVTTARELLGERAAVFEAPGLYHQREVLVAADALVSERPQVLPRLLRALVRAERFASRQPVEAIAITAAYLGVEVGEVEALWPTVQLRVTLDQSLLDLLESEARWAVESGVVEAGEIPDFRALLYRQALGEVDPMRVRLEP